jgi:hypothetical protein
MLHPSPINQIGRKRQTHYPKTHVATLPTPWSASSFRTIGKIMLQTRVESTEELFSNVMVKSVRKNILLLLSSHHRCCRRNLWKYLNNPYFYINPGHERVCWSRRTLNILIVSLKALFERLFIWTRIVEITVLQLKQLKLLPLRFLKLLLRILSSLSVVNNWLHNVNILIILVTYETVILLQVILSFWWTC